MFNPQADSLNIVQGSDSEVEPNCYSCYGDSGGGCLSCFCLCFCFL